MIVSFFKNKFDRIPDQRECTWPDLQAFLTDHHVRENKDGMLWSPATYPEEKTRLKGNVLEVSALVLDFDSGVQADFFAAHWRRFEYLVYSTFSHAPETHKWRAVFPLAVPISAPRWSGVYGILAESFGHGHTDIACSDSSRMFYTPACPAAMFEHRFAMVNAGAWVDASAIEVAEERAEDAKPPPMPSVVTNANGYFESALVRECREIEQAGAGMRNHRLNRAAFCLGTLVGAGSLGEQQVEAALHAAAINAGLKEIETRRTIRSGLMAGMKHPRTVTPRYSNRR